MITYPYLEKKLVKVFLSCLFVLSLLINTLAFPPGYKENNPVSQSPKLSGAFIQYWGDLLNEDAWKNVLDSMVRAGVHRTIIIQHLEKKTTDGVEHKYYPAKATDFDPTRFILDYADNRKDIQVYIGLREDDNFLPQSNWNNTDQYALQLNAKNGEADKNKLLAKEAWKRYGRGKDEKIRPSFAGWYLPNEMWNQNYSAVQFKELQKFHRTISDFCKSLDKNNKPVAVCPYFNPNHSPANNLTNPETFARTFGEFLKPTGRGQKQVGIDIVMLQDGAGERELTVDNYEETVKPFYISFKEMANSKKVRFWANVESWMYKPRPSFFPTDITRLEKQIEVTTPHVEQVVTFDYFHYMNPYQHFHQGEWGEAETNLYWCYVRKFSPKAIKDGDPQCRMPEAIVIR